MNSFATDLVNQYTGKIKKDDRVFGTDVMSQDQFNQPFMQWVRNTVDTTLRPEFERYQLNPFLYKSGNDLGNLNQNLGLSGGYRTGAGQVQLQDAAKDAMLQKEQLTRGFNDQAMGVMDQFQSQWMDPLYRQRMTSFYNAPWRNIDTGETTPQENFTIPELQGFSAGQQTNGAGQNMSSQYMPFTPYTGINENESSTNMQYNSNPKMNSGMATTMNTPNPSNIPRDYISQYLPSPDMRNRVSGNNVMSKPKGGIATYF